MDACYYPCIDAFTELGVSIRTVFPDLALITVCYAKHQWRVFKNDRYTIVHAIPHLDQLHASFWEEWFSVDDGPVIHHVLYCSEPPIPHHEMFYSHQFCKDLHPEELIGNDWYIIEDPSLMAWGCRMLLGL